MRALLLAAAISALALAPAAHAAGCLKDGEPVTGKFAWASSTHPNGTAIHVPFVILAKSVCVKDEFGEATGTRMQVVLKDTDAIKAYREGSMLTIEGKYGPPETAWHIGEIMAFDAEIIGSK